MLTICLTIAAITTGGQLERTVPAALERAGDNRAEIQAALDAASETQQEGMQFLVRNMPTHDLQSLSSEFLTEHVDYAYRARERAPWGDAVPQEIFLNNVLPYANINERRDAWRKDFHERFWPVVKDAKTASEAAAKLNNAIFKMVDVKYSTKRPKADQSPYESIEAKLASCTGLSILLIDACRAVGVPARFVGTPRWSDGSGNHSWVEIWDGDWHFTGAAEPTGDKLDQGWFTDRASRAQRDERRHAIYAVSFVETPQRFPLIWDRRIDYVYSLNVTDRYAAKAKAIPDDHVQIFFRVLDVTTNDRCSANLRVRDSKGNVVFQAQTKDESFDANDHIAAPLPKGETYQVEVVDGDRVVTTEIRAEEDQSLVTLRSSDDASGKAADQTKDVEGGEGAAQPVDTSATTIDPIEQLTTFLESMPAEAPIDPAEIAKQSFATTSLNKEQAVAAEELLWNHHKRQVTATRRSQLQARQIAIGDRILKFDYTVFGKKPEAGRSLYISMHGGGNTRARVNDRQWENQKGLYEPDEGIYLSPRAPTNTWNLWHEAHVDPLFDRLIETMVILEGVDPNRIYLMGYSAGGDGVYQLAGRMADRFAAAAMMAGHPNEATPLNLRNLPFTLHMGEKDGAYDRNQVAADWGQRLAELRAKDAGGYVHWVEIHAGKGHWMEREDAFAVPWMARYTRNVLPEKIVWQQDDVTHDRFYWLAVQPADARQGSLVKATRDGQTINVESTDVAQVQVRLNDSMLNLDKPIIPTFNSQSGDEVMAERQIATLAKTLAERGDRRLMFSAVLTVSE